MLNTIDRLLNEYSDPFRVPKAPKEEKKMETQALKNEYDEIVLKTRLHALAEAYVRQSLNIPDAPTELQVNVGDHYDGRIEATITLRRQPTAEKRTTETEDKRDEMIKELSKRIKSLESDVAWEQERAKSLMTECERKTARIVELERVE